MMNLCYNLMTMIYTAYLNLLSQMSFGKKAYLCLEGETIEVEEVGSYFVLSGRVGEQFPLELGAYPIDAPGSKLMQTDEGLCFIQEVTHLDRFTQFKIIILNYLDLLRFWKGVIQDLETASLPH